MPGITSVSPSSTTAGDAAFTLTVNGWNFISASTVRWDDNDRSTTFVSSTQLTASISASDISSRKSVGVTVLNPAPGGGTSSTFFFNIGPARLAVVTKSLPPAMHSKPYNCSLAASGGYPPYTWSLASGSNLPSGLSLSSSGQISGTPPVVGSDTTVNFTVQVTDRAALPQTQNQSLSILVHAGALGRNDSCPTGATPISNDVIRASITPYGDVDVYSFHGTAGDLVTIEIYAQRLVLYGNRSIRDDYLDSFLELLDSSCNQIADNDDIDPGVMQDSLIENFTLPGTGTSTYYIRVSDLGGGGRPDFIYDLHLSGAN